MYNKKAKVNDKSTFLFFIKFKNLINVKVDKTYYFLSKNSLALPKPTLASSNTKGKN